MATSNDESDTATIWSKDGNPVLRSLRRFKPRCCGDTYSTIPIVLSLISLILVIGTIFGVAIRYGEMKAELNNLKAQQGTPTSSQQKAPASLSLTSEVVYTRWGKATCPASAKLVYSGFGASSSSSSSTATGGGAQYLCMPTDPEWNKFDLKNDSYAFSWLYAAEYLSYEGYGIFPDNVHGHNVACSVCLTTGTTKLMVPAKRTCPVGWDKQYEGYLMSSYVTDTKLTFECVDMEPDIISGTQNITGGPQMFFVSGFCGEYGGLSHCPPYINGRELTCVVCTK